MNHLFGRQIPVVEDDALSLWDIEEALKEAGCTSICTAANTREAREAFGRNKSHLAILDIKLSRNTSVPVADQLASGRVPFLFLSAFSPLFLPTRHRTQLFISKPLSPAELVHRIGELLAKRNGRTASAT